MKRKKWLTILALLVMYAATLMDWQWIWGVIFILWGFSSISTGQAYLIETVEKEVDPVLFWIIVFTWFFFGLYFLSILFLDPVAYS